MVLERLQKELRAARRQQGPAKPAQAPEQPPAWMEATLSALRAHQPALAALLRPLNAAQLQAVLSEEPHLSVRAQVGSGKTTVLVHKVLYLHLGLGVPLREIAVLTFTTKAALEIRARLGALEPRALQDPEATAWMGTFHAVAHRLLRGALPLERLGFSPGFRVLDEDGREAMLEAIVSEHRLRVGRRSSLPRRLQDPGDDPELVRLAALYRAQKQAEDQLDFDDLLLHAAALLPLAALPPPAWVLVDEAQDCEPKETALVEAILGPNTKLFLVGDPLQSIYGWRGSSPGGLLSRPPRGATARVHSLPASYRSTRTILEAARAALGTQPISSGALQPMREAGAKVILRRHHDPMAEAIHLADRAEALIAQGTPPAEIGILARLKAQLPRLEEVLAARGIPVARDLREDAVQLLTLHAAKGLEFRHVFLSGINRGLMPLLHGGQDEAEERRLLFVGMTRAKHTLEIGYHACPDQPQAQGFLSPFLEAIPAAWIQPAEGPVAAPPKAAVVEPCPFTVGQAVAHPRYGQGQVRAIEDGQIEADFGKLGPKRFPIRLCPLRAILSAPPETGGAGSAR